MGPWLANDIRECDGLTTMMSYWSLSDVFEEQGIVKTPFYGGYGLMAERGIPKPAFRDFELLHRLGDRRLANPSENTLVTERADGTVVIALWNYAEPGESVAPKTFQLDVKNTEKKHYLMQFVDSDHASSLKAWKEMGSPVSPTLEQIAKLKKASELPPAEMHPLSDPITVAPQGLAVLELQ
jgi:xylan 1,4-beta-xylosidase